MAYQHEIRQVFFSNLLALGMDPIALERKWKIPFNKDMFALPNKKGFEVVMHFLFDRLNHTMCQQQFKSCWPILDKKHEQQFRKVCRDWLQTIAADDSNANLPLPRIVASLFMSPGGDKMYQLFFYFSTHIVQTVIMSETGLKQHDFLQRPVLSRQNKDMAASMASGLKASCARHWRQFIEHSQQAVAAQQEWKIYASELVKEYRVLTHDIRDLEQGIKDEVNIAAEKSASRGSPPSSSRRRSGMSEYDLDVQNVKRAQRIRQVREQWRCLDNFVQDLDKATEVIKSILEGSHENYNIDANKLNVRIPDLLLRECEQEIQRRSVGNIYKGGKLDLVSLLNLWNLSLHLFIEKIHQCGIPNLEGITPKITAQAHTHHAHLTNASKFRSQLKNQVIPDLKKEIRSLRGSLDSQVFQAKSPESIRMTSIGFGFMPPTPPVNFSAEGVDVTAVPGHESIKLRQEMASTPEAAEALMSRIDQRVKAQQQSKLVQGTPVFAGRLATQGKPTGTNTIPSSKLPLTSRVRHQRPAVPIQTSASHSLQDHLRVEEMPPHLKGSARKAMRDQVSHSKHDDQDRLRSGNKSERISSKNRVKKKEEVSAKVERHTPRPKSPKAIDLLAEEIANAVITGTPSRELRHVLGGPTDLEDEISKANAVGQAFVSRDKIARTPESQEKEVITKLFSEEAGSDEDDGIVTMSNQPEPRPEPSSHRRHHPSGCEDDRPSHPPPPSTRSPLGHNGPFPSATSPASDRIKDMRLSHTLSPGGGLPAGRSLAMTSGAMVMTGDLLGMTTNDHLDATWPRTKKVNLSFDDSSSASSTDRSHNVTQVADLPQSLSHTDSESIPDEYGLIKLDGSLKRRDVIGAEFPKAPPKPGMKLLSLLDLEAEGTGLITDEPLPGFSLNHRNKASPASATGLSKLNPDLNGNLSPYKSTAKPVHIGEEEEEEGEEAEGDGLEELANISARIIELENDSFRERPEVLPSKKYQEIQEDLGPSPFQRNTEKRGSFRDVEQSTLTSFINSSLQGLGQSLGGLMLSGGGTKSPVRSRSPRAQQQLRPPANLDAADIIARYKVLKESREAGSRSNSSQKSQSSESKNARASPQITEGQVTPERSFSPLSERYLERTPTREDHIPLIRKFDLNLDDVSDDEPELCTPQNQSLRNGGRKIDYDKLGISPLVSPESPMDPQVGGGLTETPAGRHQLRGTGTLSRTSTLQLSPYTEQLHNLDFSLAGMDPERFANIFDEESPVLLPSSPLIKANEPSKSSYSSPAVGRLIDM